MSLFGWFGWLLAQVAAISSCIAPGFNIGARIEAMTMKSVPLQGKRVLVFGDSLSVGRASPGWFLGKSIEDWTPKGAKPTVEVLGVGGMALSYFRPGVFNRKTNRWAIKARWQVEQAISWKPQTILILLGTNDYLSSGTAIASGAISLYGMLKEHTGAEIFFIGPPSFASGAKDGKINEGADRFYRVLRLLPALHGRVFDGRPSSADLVDKAARPDTIHFSKKAAQVWGLRLFHLIQKAAPASAPGGLSQLLTGAVKIGVTAWGVEKLLKWLLRTS